MKKKILLIVFIFTNIINAYSHYVKDFPKSIEQPDGTIVNCYITGDEYNLRLHDENDYTIIEDPETGFLVYAVLENDILVSSGYRVGQVSPNAIGLVQGIDISEEHQLENRVAFRPQIPVPVSNQAKNSSKAGQNDGVINNIVIYVRFSNQPEFGFGKQYYDDLFNSDEEGVSSMYRYFKDISYGKTLIRSTFYPESTGNDILSYRDSKPRSYYLPYSSNNPTGYTEAEMANREHELLARAVEAVKNQIPDTLNLDFNNDGYIDNICFVIKGSDSGSSLLWPHKWQMHTRNIYINGKRVWNYNLQLENHVYDASTLCHEMFHTLGAPDLYRGSGYFAPIGSWDIMALNQDPPQSATSYMKYKYGGWIDEIPEITRSGTYTLNDVWSDTNNCFKIASPASTGNNAEYFIVEYRNRNIFWDQSIPGSGMIIYRINPRYEGNYDGPPDEVYLFRIGGTNPTESGYINNANFSSNTGRTAFNNNTNPPCFLSNGAPAYIDIFNITQAGSTISFTIEFDPFFEAVTQSVSFGETSVEVPSNPKKVYVNAKYLEEEIEYNIVGQDAAYFSIDAGSWDSYIGGFLNVIFSPDEARNYSATLEMVVDGFETVHIPLTGSGIIVPVVANFSANTRVVWEGSEISFTDLTTGSPKAWNWTFEGGNPASSNERNPVVTYNTPGIYSVTLSVANLNTNDEKAEEQYLLVEARDENLICNNSFEYWSQNKPDCWFGEITNFTTSFLRRSDEGAYDGNYFAVLNNTYNSNKMFSSKPLSVESGSVYKISFYVRGEGQITTLLYDERDDNSGFSPSNPFINVKSDEWVKYIQYVKAGKNSSNAEFAFSVRNAVYASGYVMLDKVEIVKLDNSLVLEEIDSDGNINIVKACKGVTESEIIGLLPNFILLKDNMNQAHSVYVDWSIDNFNGNSAGTYVANGIFELPDFLEQPTPPLSLAVTRSIVINDIPVVTCPDNMTVSNNSVTELTGALPEGGIYSGDGVSGSTFNPEGLDFSNGYQITYKYINQETACEDSCTFLVNISTSAVENPMESVKIYPNPSNGMFYIESTYNARIEIYSITGKLILEKEASNNDVLNLESYSKGIYILNITDSKGLRKTKKLIIQ